MKILIVDSSTEIIQRLKELLQDIDEIVSIYSTTFSSKAATLFEDSKPDVVLLDLNLPGNQSIDFLKLINATPKSALVIGLFIHLDQLLQNQFNKIGIDYLIDKYDDFEKIPGIINSIVRSRKIAG